MQKQPHQTGGRLPGVLSPVRATALRKALVLLALSLCCLAPGTAFANKAKQADALYQEAIRKHGSASAGEVFKLYARAAEMGNAAAQYNVAMMYCNGEAVNVDYQQAAYWFGKSAAQSFPPALYRLGEMHKFGKGGLQHNPAMARHLFESAAELGDADAQMNLAIMLASGEESETDVAQARNWMDRAEQGGHGDVSVWRDLLDANGPGGLTPRQSERYWNQQQQYWIDRAAVYGVREAQEALEGLDPRG